MHHAISHCSIFITKFETIFRKEYLYILLPAFMNCYYCCSEIDNITTGIIYFINDGLDHLESFKWVSFHMRKHQIQEESSLTFTFSPKNKLG